MMRDVYIPVGEEPVRLLRDEKNRARAVASGQFSKIVEVYGACRGADRVGALLPLSEEVTWPPRNLEPDFFLVSPSFFRLMITQFTPQNHINHTALGLATLFSFQAVC